MKTRLVILGAGIKGTALAALASLCGFAVTLIDRQRIAAGSTSANHGRLHLGTAGWREDAPALVRRRRTGSELIRSLPDAIVSREPARYCFEDEHEFGQFQRFAAHNGIAVRPSAPPALAHPWIDSRWSSRIVELAEYSFDPARLAARFAQTSLGLGGTLKLQCLPKRILRGSNELVIGFEDGSSLSADVVVNTMSRWCNDLALPDGAPRLAIEWWRWCLLCFPVLALEAADPLGGVLVVVDRARSTPSAVPHPNWITLDFKETSIAKVDSPEGAEAKDWRPLDTANQVDTENIAVVADSFPPVRRAIARGRGEQIYSLAGIQPRIVGAARGSTNQLFSNAHLPGYLLAFGGQASTALLDAFEIITALSERGLCHPFPRHELLATLADSLSATPHPEFCPMRWERPDATTGT